MNSKENKAELPGQQPCLVVGIGASAGGQAALEQLFTTMPTDCGLSFVVVMHLSPEGPSYLADILGRYTSMAVVTAKEGMQLLPNRVQVIPPGKELVIRDGVISLENAGCLRGIHHPIDRFLHSLASEAGERAVAVILSGYGMDGTEGVQSVREAGGKVIIQEPASAINPAMPASAIATGAAHVIAPAEEIPAELAGLAKGHCPLPDQACAMTSLDEELRKVFEIVKAKTGHDYSSYKQSTVIRRIERRMAVNDSAGMKKYLAFLEEDDREAATLGQEILIGVTSFFRDAGAFDVLRREVIPRLFSGRNPDDPVRIWHACCASGEEVYSTAILIQEYLDQRGIDTKVQFFATDIDEAAIAQARAGMYTEDSVAEIGDERLKNFFNRIDGRWQVSKRLREMIVFAHHSLIKDPPFTRLDLVVCRNFLIYLNQDMQKRLISLFHYVLKPDGVLFLGASESTGRKSDLFEPLDAKWKIFKRVANGRRDDTVFPFSSTIRRPLGTAHQQPSAASGTSNSDQAEKLLMERFFPPYLVVNEKYEAVRISQKASAYLKVPAGEPTRDILKMALEELRPALRAAIYKAMAEQKQVSFRGIKLGAECGGALNITVAPFMESGDEKRALVTLEPAPQTSISDIARSDEGRALNETSAETLIIQLEEQLRITHEQLQVTSEQLETSQEGFMSANEELMSINEEFQSANEELQSTNEELETSKEELQALNEELITLNSELKGKVEELDQATSDMENLLASSEIAALFLDREFTIKRFTPAMARTLNLIQADIGRPFRHVAGAIDWPGLSSDASEVLEKLTPIEREVGGVDDGCSYLMRVLPYRTPSGGINGIVVTLVDITELRRAEDAILRAKEQWERTFDSVPDLIAILDEKHRIVSVNNAMAKRLGLAKEECIGKLCYEAVHGTNEPPQFCPHTLTTADGREHRTEVHEAHLGGDFLVTTTPLLNENGSMTGSVHVARDITERKKLEAARARLAAIVESSYDAIIAKDLDGIIRSWNSGAERMFGYVAEEVVGKPVSILVPEHLFHEKEDILCRLSNGESIESYETVRLRRDGRLIDVSLTVSPIRDGAGGIIGCSTIIRDISARKRAEDEMKRAKTELLSRMEELERFNSVSVGRELRMIELKKEINGMCVQAGLAPRFPLGFEEE